MRRLYEGRARRAFTHIGSPYGYLSSLVGSVGGRSFGEGPLARRGLRRKQERTGSPLHPFDPVQYKAVGGLAGDWAGRQTGALGGGALSAGIQGKDVYALDTAKDPVKAGKEYTKKHRVSAAFVLPKNKHEMTKLANRGALGHAGHGALRFMFGGPVNVARYGAKVSYARSGYRREDINMLRDDLIEAIVEASFADAMVIPKNKFERDKLANRSTLGHVGHGMLRYIGGEWLAAPVSVPLRLHGMQTGNMGSMGAAAGLQAAGGVANVVRYAKKVKNAKLGKHREQKEYRDR